MILVLLLACTPGGASGSAAPAPAPVATPAGDAPVPVSVPADALPTAAPVPTTLPPATPPLAMRTPRALYAACQDRVEGAGASGECASDADCARAGCASEVCVAAKQAPEVMTGCDVLDCFSVLDSCGCHDGLCTWTLKLPAPGPTPLPAR